MQLTINDIKKLQQKKYREEFGHFLVEGEHLLLELHKALAKNNSLLRSELLVTPQCEHIESPLKKRVITNAQMLQISDTQTPQGIIALVPLVSLQPQPLVNNQKAIYLYQIQDPGNLGSILRILAWFGSYTCLLSPDSVDPHNSKVIRASMGGIFHVPIEVDVNINTLSQRYSSLACLSMSGKALKENSFSTHDCYLFGNEARGLPDTISSTIATYSIAGCGAIDSLNLASAVSMCLYELNR
jgi:RNA methyltransferase, TrmH family